MSKMLCFKPTRNIHESGYRYIQYGYMGSDEADAEVEIIGRYDILQTPYDIPVPFNLDLTKSGWFRIMPKKNLELEWKYGGEIAIKETPAHPVVLEQSKKEAR